MATISITPPSDSTAETIAPVCLAVRACLDEFVDGEMSDVKSASITAHLQSCPMCRRAAASLQGLLESLKRSQLSVLASRRLRLRVAQLFNAPESRER